MIDKNRTYKTRDGREVRIYATDGVGRRCVHGAILNTDGKGVLWSWTEDGRSHEDSRQYDLIEVKPRIKRTVWLNVMDYGVIAYPTRKAADHAAWSDRQACGKIEIDCEVGEGLGEGEE